MAKESSLPASLSPLRDQFRIMKECPLCDASFVPESFHVVEKTGSAHILHTTCGTCKSSFTFVVGTTHMGMALIALMTDLDLADVRRFKGREPLSEDDILEAYRVLEYAPQLIIHSLFS